MRKELKEYLVAVPPRGPFEFPEVVDSFSFHGDACTAARGVARERIGVEVAVYCRGEVYKAAEPAILEVDDNDCPF